MAPVRIDAEYFSPDSCAFIELLHRHGVRYVIVGGEAVIFHGHARLTGDIDFFFGPETGNGSRLFAALDQFWSGDIPGIESVEELTDQSLILQFGRPPNRIDLMNHIEGVSFEDVWRGRVEAVLVTSEGELSVSYIGLDELIRNKRAAGRPRDLDDLAYLEATRRR
ncbi:MAG TPA: DUF6036 family nucleotidyltransferase [Longimicrobiales bacterium]|nr:DUF6036 family nucleotidyltransferase [Longimicrobiales bacterium]